MEDQDVQSVFPGFTAIWRNFWKRRCKKRNSADFYGISKKNLNFEKIEMKSFHCFTGNRQLSGFWKIPLLDDHTFDKNFFFTEYHFNFQKKWQINSRMRHISIKNLVHHLGKNRQRSKSECSLDDVRRVLLLWHGQKTAQQALLDDGVTVFAEHSWRFDDVLDDVVGELVRCQTLAFHQDSDETECWISIFINIRVIFSIFTFFNIKIWNFNFWSIFQIKTALTCP